MLALKFLFRFTISFGSEQREDENWKPAKNSLPGNHDDWVTKATVMLIMLVTFNLEAIVKLLKQKRLK